MHCLHCHFYGISNYFFSVETSRRQQLLLEMFIERPIAGSTSPSSQTPFSILVKKLQESLTRMESFEVVTVSQGIDGKSILELLQFMPICLSNRLETQLGVDACPTAALALGR